LTPGDGPAGRAGGRPPWWPQGEPFPPPWRGGPRRRFPRRLGFLFGVFMALAFFASGFVFRWLGGGFEPGVRAVPGSSRSR
jgi:hypothetical protein